ncbi:MAG: DNA polymerase I [Candidatus Omnitrophica bacterium]|nr:DNA polymerase I [Candidatus Omnitrophota bacterium]
MTEKQEQIYLIDGNSLCYRAYYAIKELATSKGRPTNAIYGFINILEKIKREYGPEMMVVAFDTPAPTERHKRYEEYKIHRKPMPDDLVEQMPEIKKVIKAFGIPVLEKDGYEADDIIATVAERARDQGKSVVIVSGDKDALQLVGEKVKVLSPSTSAYNLYGPDEVKEKFGVEPGKMVELMALMGDASDNVPGVKGVGKVTAARLIDRYRTVEGLYGHLEELSASLKQKLSDSREDAELSRELVTLDRQVPVDLELSEAAVREPDTETLIQLYKEYEFNKLLKEIAPRASKKVNYEICDADRLKAFAAGSRGGNGFAFFPVIDDTSGRLSGLALSAAEGSAIFVPTELVSGGGDLARLMRSDKVTKVCFDLKAQLRLFRRSGISIGGPFFDVMLADYLIDPSRPKYEPDDMAIRYLDRILSSGKKDVNWDTQGQGMMDLSEGPGDIEYFCERADLFFTLRPRLEDELRDKTLIQLFETVEMPLAEILADMEDEGVTVDLDFLSRASSEMGDRLEKVTAEIYGIAGEEFNINSPKQLQVILYEKLGLPALKKTKTGISTDESVLKRLARNHGLPEKLLEYRELNKLKTAYYDSIRKQADPSGKIHALFNQAVTATGRLSSSEPNLQNIPVKTPMGQEIRKAFIPSSGGRLLLASDYSQVELRVLAHLSGDRNLIKAFERSEDVHKYTASLIFDSSLEEVTPEMRSVAKTVNFGIVYGISAFGLSKDLNIRIDEAQGFIDAYFERYSGIREFIERTVSEACGNGYVTTILGRRRYIPEINSSNDRIKGFAERAAVNTPVQGSAADLIKLAMIECGKEFRDSDVKMILQVHDELVFDVPGNRLKKAAAKVKKMMESVFDLKVPLVADVEYGPNWLEMEPMDF